MQNVITFKMRFFAYIQFNSQVVTRNNDTNRAPIWRVGIDTQSYVAHLHRAHKIISQRPLLELLG